MKRKLLSILLTLCLAFSLLPTAALADEGEGGDAAPAAANGNVAKIGDTEYTTLAEAVAAVHEKTGDERSQTYTIELLRDATGSGFGVGYDKIKNETTEGNNPVHINIEMNGHTYTVSKPTVGSSGTETNGLQLLKGSTVTLKNGTLNSVTGEDSLKNGGILIQNYCNLTLENVTLDTSANSNISYVISNNFGSLTAKGNTVIKAADGKVAFDLWYGMNDKGLYDDGVSVTFGTDFTGSVTGKIEYGAANRASTMQWPEKTKLTIENGKFEVTFVDSNAKDGFALADANISITGGTFSSDVSAYVPNGYIQNENGAVETLGETNAVAKVGDTYYKTLAAAVTAAKDGNTVKILRDVNTAERHDVVGKKLILDLNGQTITTTIAEQFMNIRGGGKLTVTDNSASKDGKIISPTGDYIFVVFKGELDFQAGTVDARGYWQYDNNGTTEYYGNTIVLVYGDTNDTENYATVTLGENANLIATTKAVDEMPVGEAYAIMVDKNKAESAYGVKVDIKGTTEHAGLYVNGVVKKTEGNVPVFNIYDGAVVDGQIYSAGYAKWNIYGGKITGSTGMEIRAGELNMTGGSLTGTATPTTVTPNGNGGTSDGAGLAIAQHTTKLPVIVNISDGTISGYSALYESNPQNNDSNSIAKVQIAVTGGNFAAINGGTKAGYSQDKTGFITGGYFTSKPAKEYIATGYYVVESDKDGYSCMISDTVPTKAQVIVNDTTAVTPPTNAHLTEADKTAIRTKTNVDGVAEAAAGRQNRNGRPGHAGVNASAVDASKLIEVEVAVDVAVSDVQKNAEGTAISTITFTAKPTATVKVDGNATGTPVPVENSMLNGQAITVKLPLPADFELKQIIHKSAGYADEYILQEGNAQGLKSFKIVEEDGVEIAVFTVSHFSDFELSGKVTYVAPSYSSGSSSSDPTYSVSTPSKTENGSVTVSPKSASKGDTVTVTVKPDSGYVLETLTVTDKNGNELTLKDKGNGKYTFTMPAGKVEVKATFMEDNSMLNFFYDVPNNAYFYEAVKWAVKNGITTGVGNDLFAPEQPCTRAQIVTFLWRAAGSPVVNYLMPFTDVDEGAYYAEAVRWAASTGIVTGLTETTFGTDSVCTRAQAAAMIYRCAQAQGKGFTGAWMFHLPFTDVPEWAYESVAWCYMNGVTTGVSETSFAPGNDCTRAQIVTFLWRCKK